MVETSLRPKTLFERLQGESHGRDIVQVAVDRLVTDTERREFFEQYVAFLTPPNNPRAREDVRKRAVANILQAIPDHAYGDYEKWSRTLNPRALPVGQEIFFSPQTRQRRR
jgi:hypothetical protein